MTQSVHLVYIHGFQGNDTSFQSFPLDLQEHLATRISGRSDVKIRSSLYPTYKSIKPLSYATKNFLEWLQTQPPDPVILLGHSMGGLLAAEAATDPSNEPNRIIGVVAFDTPYLGMHPHVIISGLASLLPKGNGRKESEKEMNPHPNIQIVPEQVTDEWEEFKRTATPQTRLHDESSSTLSASPSAASSHFSSWPSKRSPSPLVNHALKLFPSYLENPFVHWLTKHSDDPVREGKRWIVERMQFGGAMFDPTGLKERYSRLVNWRNGRWVNYWTQTLPDPHIVNLSDNGEKQSMKHVADNNIALVQTGVVDSSQSGWSIEEDWAQEVKGSDKTKKKKQKNKAKVARHFIVLPTGLGKHLGGSGNWEKVVIAGVDDEVAAHCGLFIRGQNLDYDGLLQRVGERILVWCEISNNS